MRARVGSLRLYAGDPDGARADLDAALRGFAGRPNTVEYADTEVSRATLAKTKSPLDLLGTAEGKTALG